MTELELQRHAANTAPFRGKEGQRVALDPSTAAYKRCETEGTINFVGYRHVFVDLPSRQVKMAPRNLKLIAA